MSTSGGRQNDLPATVSAGIRLLEHEASERAGKHSVKFGKGGAFVPEDTAAGYGKSP